MITVFGFDNKLHVFINLFLLCFSRHGFNHIAAGKDFVQYSFAEHFVPASGAAGSNTADNNGFLIRIFLAGRGRGNLAGTNGIFRFSDCFLRYRSIAGYPFYKSGVKGAVVAIHICTGKIYADTGRNQIGKQVVKFHDSAFFGVVGSHYFNIFFIGQSIGG